VREISIRHVVLAENLCGAVYPEVLGTILARGSDTCPSLSLERKANGEIMERKIGINPLKSLLEISETCRNNL